MPTLDSHVPSGVPRSNSHRELRSRYSRRAILGCLLGIGSLPSLGATLQAATVDGIAARWTYLQQPPEERVELEWGCTTPLLDEASAPGSLLASDENLRRVAAQQIDAVVSNELRRAQDSRNPSSVKIALKGLLEQVRRAPELDVSNRAKLETKVIGAIQTAAKAEAIQREQSAKAEAIQANAAASGKLRGEKERKNATIQQLVERFNALMDQRLYAAANDEIAPQIAEIESNTPIHAAIGLESNSLANYRLTADAVHERRRAFVDSLQLNEKGMIPFVDEPPVRYPPADVWQALSARRLERYASIDLSGGSASQRKIFRALGERTDLQFNAMPLSHVLTFFSDKFDIPILIDDKALEAEGVTREEQITMNLPEVSLRSALKLILEPMRLTYVIEDEVMRITSKTGTANIIRVYPVGDLVVPIVSGGGMGGGGFGSGAGSGFGNGLNGGAGNQPGGRGNVPGPF